MYKYRFEIKVEKKVRFIVKVEKKAEGKDELVGKKSVIIKYGFNYVISFVENKKV